MIRRTPCEYYLKYLLVHPDGYSLRDIQLILREHQLDYPGDIPVQKLQNRIRKPPIFRPYDKRHSPTFRFLVSEGLYNIFHPDAAMKAAVALLKKPRAKELLESMTICEDPTSYVLHRLKGMGITLTEKELKRYYFYFWNLELVDRSELRVLLQMRVDSMLMDGDDLISVMRHKAMKRAAYDDPRFVAASSQVSSFASVMNQIRHNHMPDPIDLPSLLARVRDTFIIRSAEAGLDQGPMASRQALDFTTSAKNVNELLESIGAPSEDLQRNLMNLMLDNDQRQVPYIHELTDGRHTVDVQPIADHNVE